MRHSRKNFNYRERLIQTEECLCMKARMCHKLVHCCKYADSLTKIIAKAYSTHAISLTSGEFRNKFIPNIFERTRQALHE